MMLPHFDSSVIFCGICSIAVFLFGTIIGSFLNVVVLRYKTGKTLNGRSMCFNCGATLKWYELVPLMSYIMQRGKCRTCRSRISPQYFLVELTLGLTYLATYLVYGMSLELLFLAIIWTIFLGIAVYDILHKIIPDRFLLVALLAITIWLLSALFVQFPVFGEEITILNILLRIVTGIGMALPFALLWLFSKGRLMGLGDPKLMFVMGYLLGFPLGISALVISFWIGALVGIGLLIMYKVTENKKASTSPMKHEIPFGPFLVLGTFLVTLFSFDIFSFVS